LEKISTDLTHKTHCATWESIFERLHDASMPPKKAEQPKPADKTPVLAFFYPALHLLLHQQTEGRVPLRRRLSRSQFQGTPS
jgi:hypothetical protein